MVILFTSLSLLLLSIFLAQAALTTTKTLKFPNKPRPFYPIFGDFASVTGLAVSPITDEIFFCDDVLHQIFKISGDRQFLVAGAGGSPGHKDGHLLGSKFFGPQGLSFHPNGSILAVADTENHVIRILDLARSTVTTLAGSPGKNEFKNGIGSAARFFGPADVAFGDNGMLYVADTLNHAIRMIDVNERNVTTFAGTLMPKWDLTEGIATKVSLNRPQTIFFESSNDTLIYFSDSYNNAIRVVDSEGYLKTVARDKSILPYGITKIFDRLIVSDQLNDCIRSINLSDGTWSTFAGAINFPGFYDGQKKDAQLNQPNHLTVSKSKDLIVGDYGNNALRLVSLSSGLLYTILRQRSGGYEDGAPFMARFSRESNLKYDSIRNVLYVADSLNNAIRRIHIDQGYKVDTLAGKPYSGFVDGSLNEALFNSPYFVTIDPLNNDILYVSDMGNYAKRLINLTFTGSVSTISKFNVFPYAVETDLSGNLYVFLYSGEIYKLRVGDTNNPIPIAGDGTKRCLDGESMTASIGFVFGLLFDQTRKELIFSDYPCNCIRSLTLHSDKENTIRTISGQLAATGFLDGYGNSARFFGTVGIDFDGENLFIIDIFNNAIRRMNMTSQYVETFAQSSCGNRNGNLSIAQFCKPLSIAVNDNIVFFSDYFSNSVRMIKNGQVVTIAGYGAKIYTSTDVTPSIVAGSRSIIALDVDRLLLVDEIYNCILEVSTRSTSMAIKVISGDGSAGWREGIGLDAMLNRPSDIILSENRSSIFITDSKNHLIRKLDLSNGRLTTFAGTGFPGNEIRLQLLQSSFNDPQGLALDARSEILYVADSGNNCIKRIFGSIITIWAGSVIAGFKDGVSTSALFAKPLGLVFDPESDCLFVADTYNHAIRKVDAKRVVTTVLGVNGTYGYIDGDANIAKLQFPTKVVLGRSKGELLILDSGNHAVRHTTIKWNLSTILLDLNADIQGISLDSLGNIYISDFQGIRIISNKDEAIEPSKEPLNTLTKQFLTLVIVSVVIFSGSCCAIAYKMLYKKRQLRQTTDILQNVGLQDSLDSKKDSSKTISPSRTVAIAIPGYLCVKLENTITIPKSAITSGKGGTATVIKASLKDPNLIAKHGVVDIVVKFFGNETSEESFLYEVTIMNNLPKSPNVIELIGFCKGHKNAIIMKCYPMSLREFLENFKSNSVTAKYNDKIAVDIANGMNLIHQKGIVHFDLKPANILAHFVEGTVVCVICDFGFANFISDIQDKIIKGVKKPTSLGITARYAAPELFLKVNTRGILPVADEIEKKIDIYAYAMTIFYVYERVTPWKDLPTEEIASLVLAGERPKITENVPEYIKVLIIKSWHVDPQARPSFAEILQVLTENFEKRVVSLVDEVSH